MTIEDGIGIDNPLVWPACEVCHLAYILRRLVRLREDQLTFEWLWQRDCKHKGTPILFNADGPYVQS